VHIDFTHELPYDEHLLSGSFAENENLGVAHLQEKRVVRWLICRKGPINSALRAEKNLYLVAHLQKKRRVALRGSFAETKRLICRKKGAHLQRKMSGSLQRNQICEWLICGKRPIMSGSFAEKEGLNCRKRRAAHCRESESVSGLFAEKDLYLVVLWQVKTCNQWLTCRKRESASGSFAGKDL